MMIERLKANIENKSINDNLIIFYYHDNDFIPTQYYREIANIKNLNINLIDSLDSIKSSNIDMWGSESLNTELNIIRLDEFNEEKLFKADNTIIITKKVSKKALSVFDEFIVDVPKLESWHSKDFAYSLLPNVDKQLIDKYIIHPDIYKTCLEIERVKLFGTTEALNLMIHDGCFSDKCDNSLFDFTNAIFKKDINSIKSIYKQLEKIDFSEYGLLSLLYTGFRNIILVQLSNNPNPETCGLSNGQFWAIKKNNIGYYTKEQLIKIFREISSIDKRVKTGKFDVKLMVDYLLVFILSI